jgi:DegV family protein with EDD domain
MGATVVCTDSTSLLAPAAATQLGVDVVPLHIALDGEPFDGETDDFYARMRAGAVASTSQPSPAEFAATYAQAAAKGAERVLSFHLDARVSGVAGSAELAAADASVAVDVIALETVSYGVAVCVRAAAIALRTGASAPAAVASAQETADALDNVFATRASSGRVSAPDDVWAVLRFADGRAETLSTHATRDGAVEAMTRRVAAHPMPIAVAVGHAAREVEAPADAFAHALLGFASVRAVERYRVEPSVGAHSGADSFGAFLWRV